ncbi:enoyl-CoA hydratase/isomerase family protein [Bordetella pertussis H973]|nr:enoyl-CoA hydratase/isomerase family protein [Bordetella pertussis H973]
MNQESTLAGVRVIEICNVAAGPFCGMLLADMGADVVKIEPPGTGDTLRSWAPITDGYSENFASLNRNKRSVTLNLKNEAERDAAIELIAGADVLIENNRPGVMDRLGLGQQAMRARNPRLGNSRSCRARPSTTTPKCWPTRRSNTWIGCRTSNCPTACAPGRSSRRCVLTRARPASCAARPGRAQRRDPVGPGGPAGGLSAMSASLPLTITRQPAAWTFTLSRPEKRNALSAELVEALIDGVDAAHREQVPLLVFAGAGRNFSAGFDFTDYETQSEGDLLLRMVRIEMLLQRVAGSPSLTLALAHGRNFGAGVDLFAACKWRYCTPEAGFRMPGLKFGLVLGTRRFRDIVGADQALSILGSARAFDADEARRIGFVRDCAAQAQWPALIDAAAEAATALDPATRATLHRVLRDDHDDADLAALARSAAQPGFKARIRDYLAQ